LRRSSAARPRRSARRRRDGLALGTAICRDARLDRDRAAAVREYLASSLRQDRTRLERAGAGRAGAFYGAPTAAAAFVHAMLAEYLSFIVLLLALYVVAGGILITGNLRGTPLVNTALLAIGTLIASLVGTTGAAMILIRPLLKANEGRAHNVHTIVFFIVLVANIGGALSPLGDPPLFVGFLRGVEFFWPLKHIWLQTLIVAAPILMSFLALDTWLSRNEPARGDEPIALQVTASSISC